MVLLASSPVHSYGALSLVPIPFPCFQCYTQKQGGITLKTWEWPVDEAILCIYMALKVEVHVRAQQSYNTQNFVYTVERKWLRMIYNASTIETLYSERLAYLSHMQAITTMTMTVP